MIPDLLSNREARTWVEQAACRGTNPDIFFDEQGATVEAKRICRTCPVTQECLEYAIANGEKHGVWGGMTARARKDRYRVARRKICPECEQVFTLQPGERGDILCCSDGCRTSRRARLQYESNQRNRVA